MPFAQALTSQQTSKKITLSVMPSSSNGPGGSGFQYEEHSLSRSGEDKGSIPNQSYPSKNLGRSEFSKRYAREVSDD
jgi:hypothetical protein